MFSKCVKKRVKEWINYFTDTKSNVLENLLDLCDGCKKFF
jgi:hypothetical protein